MSFQNILFSFVLAELAMGGGGRFTSAGDLSLRMILFMVSMLFMAFNFNLIKKDYLTLSFCFIGLLIFSSFVGVTNNAKMDLVIEDVKILSYFPMILFFSLNINSLKQVNHVVNIIKISSVAVSIGYLCTYYSLEMGILNYKSFYDSTFDYGELFFRNETAFFYKGFLFSATGVLFFIFNEKSKNRLINILRLASVGIIAYSIFMTYTRGLMLSLFLSALFVYLYSSIVTKQTSKLLLYGLGFGILAFFLSDRIGSILAGFAEVRSTQDDSDSIRILTIDQVFTHITPMSLLIGHGFGIGVEIRPIHMEISYLEIFHKQGMLGISFYTFLLTKLMGNYYKLLRNVNKDFSVKMKALAFMAASFFVYIQSATNPLLNNPIGISIVLISIVAMDTLNTESVVDNNNEYLSTGYSSL
jgi:hypothetical protein